MIYRFSDCELDTDRFELRVAGEVRKVEPQVFSLIELLVANHSRMVAKDEINLRVWGGRPVSDAVVNSRIRAARQAIGDDGKAQALIRTVHRRGFRFVGEVRAAETPIPAGHAVLLATPSQPPQDLADAAAPGARPSIAVMPLQVLTPGPDHDHLGDALSHEVIIELARLHWLSVIARGSSFRFRGPQVDLAHAGRVLGVRYVLTGSVAVHDRTSSVAVELVNAADGGVVWAERYRWPIDDLMRLKLTLSAQIAGAVETRIQQAESDRAAHATTESLDAWSAYHLGLSHMYRFNRHDNEVAARLFERAVGADPHFARAHAGLSFTHFQKTFLRFSDDAAVERDLTRRHAETALGLDPLDPFVNLTMGRSAWISGDLDGSIAWFDRSTQLSPNYAFALYNRGLIEALLGAGERSQQDVTQAMVLSPLDPLGYAMLATRALSHLVRGEFAPAAQWAARATRAPGAHVHIHAIAALAHELSGDREGAANYVGQVRALMREYRKEDMLRHFNFRDEATLSLVRSALGRLRL